MMSRHRYEAIPLSANSISSQPRPRDTSIPPQIPHSSASSTYNFNTGLQSSASSLIDTPSRSSTPTPAYPGTTPTSTSTSTSHHHTTQSYPYPPSLHSIPNSPPPSFHTHSTPSTPRARSILTGLSGSTGSGMAGPYNELWGVATSTNTGGGDATSNDALATIAGLKQRVEWLEESIGKLILAKERCSDDEDRHGRAKHNCCVSFEDGDEDLERAVLRGRSNCCVKFERGGGKKKRVRNAVFVIYSVGLVVCVVLIMIAYAPGRREEDGGSGGYGVVKMVEGDS